MPTLLQRKHVFPVTCRPGPESIGDRKTWMLSASPIAVIRFRPRSGIPARSVLPFTSAPSKGCCRSSISNSRMKSSRIREQRPASIPRIEKIYAQRSDWPVGPVGQQAAPGRSSFHPVFFAISRISFRTSSRSAFGLRISASRGQ